MIQLVTKADLDQYKHVADSIKNSTQWPQFVSEAQMFDIKIQIGDALLMELVAQATTLPTTFSVLNQTLLDGGAYVYNTKTYHFQGLKAAIIYYAFGRFTNRTNFNYTPAGIVVKESDLSTPVTDKILQRLETEARLMAESIMCEVKLYLTRNYASYPLWADIYYCGSTRCNDDRRWRVEGD